MNRQACAILLLAAVALQAMLGGLRGATTLCLGGGHDGHGEHTAAAVIECEQACDHHGDVALVGEDHDHGDDCGCIDVDLDVAELITMRSRDTGPIAVPIAAPMWAQCFHTTCEPRRGPPRLVADDPGGRHRLAVVRSTRLII